MNCQNCAAPLTQSAGPLRMICSFCHTIHRTPDLSEIIDRVLVIGEDEGVPCPLCDAGMVSAQVDEVRTCFCHQCRGLLLSSPEFRRVVETRRAGYSGPELAAGPAHAVELDRRLTCPGCHQTMEVHPYYGAGRAVIDSCATCALVWVDCGELTSLEVTPGRRTPPVLETLHLVADEQETSPSEQVAAPDNPLTTIMRAVFSLGV